MFTLMCFGVMAVAGFGVMFCKNQVTYKNRNAIIEAIGNHNEALLSESRSKIHDILVDEVESGKLDLENKAEVEKEVNRLFDSIYESDRVDYASLESYDKTLYRLWDWSCDNIVPSKIYEKIKPYMAVKSEKED